MSFQYSLILLVVEAGIDIDLSTLQLIGTRGFLIAFIGSIAPIGLGMLITWILDITDVRGIIAAGAVFGPTSLGIALNILRGGGVLNTYVELMRDAIVRYLISAHLNLSVKPCWPAYYCCCCH